MEKHEMPPPKRNSSFSRCEIFLSFLDAVKSSISHPFETEGESLVTDIKTYLVHIVHSIFQPQIYYNRQRTHFIMNILRLKRSMSTKPLLKFDIFKPAMDSGKPLITHHTSTMHKTPNEISDDNHTKNNSLPPIIFLHGLLGNKKNNKSAAIDICNLLGTTVITPDLRNHGQSFHSDELMTHEAMADDIHDLYNHLVSNKELDVGKVVIMGHSLGGKVAMHFGLKYPQITSGITSIDNPPYTNPPESLPEFQKFRDSLRIIKERVAGNEKLHNLAAVDKILQEVEEDPNFRLFVMSNLIRTRNASGEGHHYESRVPIDTILRSIPEFIEFDKDASPQPYTNPLLIIKATQSNFTAGLDEPENVRKITALFPAFEEVKIDSGHWVVSECREEFVRVVGEWYRHRVVSRQKSTHSRSKSSLV